jgi:tripartite-type tricarboxylate transporter receptor subunit TctC
VEAEPPPAAEPPVAAEPPQDGSTMHMREAPINHNAMRFAALMLGTLALAGQAGAQDWPTRQLTMVVPFAAGGPVDVIARIVQRRLGEVLGQQIVVENVGSAGGMTGSLRVAQAAPDGYTFVLGSSGTHAINQSLYKKPLYNAATDFAPVMLVAEAPLVLITRKDLPPADFKEFVAYAKANPKLNYGSGGGVGNFSCMLLGTEAGIDIVHVPYRGAVLATQDLLAGRIDLMCEFVSTAFPQIKAGSVKAIAALSRDRLPMLPDVASAHEQGLTGFDIDSWLGLFVPKGTPLEIVRKLNAGLVAALESETVKSRFEKVGVMIVPPQRRSVDFLAKLMQSETEKWTAPITASMKAQK